jgi:hypothetical protein
MIRLTYNNSTGKKFPGKKSTAWKRGKVMVGEPRYWKGLLSQVMQQDVKEKKSFLICKFLS